MPGEIISPNMSLILPGVGDTLGPQWATDLNSSLTIVDSHNHSSGSGVQITPDGMDVNAELTIKNNNLTNIRSLRLQVQPSVLADAADVSCVYSTDDDGDLYYNDGNGNQIQITQNGGIAGSPGSISNLTSPASASYVSVSSKFVWQSDVNKAANMDFGAAIMRNLTTSSFALTLQPPTLSANYALTLPPLPVSQKIMTLDAAGAMSAPYVVDNSTIEISTNTIQVKDLGITAAKLAANSVTTSKILDANVTRPKLEAIGQQISSSCGSFSTASGTPVDITNLTITITTSGRPVILMLKAAGASVGQISTTSNSGGIFTGQILLVRDASTISENRLGFNSSVSQVVTQIYAPGILNYPDTPVAGTYTYKLQAAVISGDSFNFLDCVLFAYEL